MTEPQPDEVVVQECSDEPKLTAEEWAYVEAVTESGVG